jgi:hypothetical protein
LYDSNQWWFCSVPLSVILVDHGKKYEMKKDVRGFLCPLWAAGAENVFFIQIRGACCLDPYQLIRYFEVTQTSRRLLISLHPDESYLILLGSDSFDLNCHSQGIDFHQNTVKNVLSRLWETLTFIKNRVSDLDLVGFVSLSDPDS